MPSARELLEQADALMQRNRAAVIDTEIPELTEIVAMIAAPAATPVAAPVRASVVAAAPVDLDDVPELTEAVEEIEIESIVELPEDMGESSGWLHHEHGPLSVIGGGPNSVASTFARTNHLALNVERAARSALSVVGKATEPAPAAAAVAPEVPEPVEAAPEPPAAIPVAVAAAASNPPAAAAASTAPVPAAGSDEWARWEVLADEIRMQVLQRIDIFTDTRLRDQLSAQLQPIVDRASAEMVATINAHVGGLLRAHIAEAIEREIEKWRSGAAR
jgi:hypothetical protein